MSRSDSDVSATFPWRPAALLLVTVAAAALWYQFGRGSQSAGERTVEPAPNRTQVHALGRLEPAGTILELAPESGNEGAIVQKILVREGDDVKAGTILAVFDNVTRREAHLREAQARLETAQSKLEQVRAGTRAGEIDAQEAAVALTLKQSEVASRELTRGRELFTRDALNEEELEDRQWQYDRLLLEHRRAKGLLDSLKEIRETDVRVAEKEIAAAAAAVAVAESELRSSTLRAPSDGRILRIHTHPGERLNDRGLLQLGDVQHMQAVAEVFEADVMLLSEGMKADVIVDGMHEKLQGVIREIGNLVARKVVLTNDPVSDTDARVVEVRIDLDAKSVARVLRLPNSRIEVHIHLDSAEMPAAERAATSTN